MVVFDGDRAMTVEELKKLIDKYLDDGLITLDGPVLWQSDEFQEYGAFVSDIHYEDGYLRSKVLPFNLKEKLEYIDSEIAEVKSQISDNEKNGHDCKWQYAKLSRLESDKEKFKSFENGLVLGELG